MKKNILFVANSLNAGGVEKALVSLLNVLPYELYDVDLLLFNKEGLFLSQVPSNVNFILPPDELKKSRGSLSSMSFYRGITFRRILAKVRLTFNRRFNKNNLHTDQLVWMSIKDNIPYIDKEYDVAIAFKEGLSTYFAMDRVRAKKHIFWVHVDYKKFNYQPSYDFNYFRKADTVFTISEMCLNSLKDSFASIQNKFDVVENVVSVDLIKKLSQENEKNDYFFKDSKIKLLSIGRLSYEKGFDMAIGAASLLKKSGVNFCWYVIGDGALKISLLEQIEKEGVKDVFTFLGLKSNPYPYLHQADIFVMPSRTEGKSIALDEAKILCKPIVSTKYPSVYDNLEDGVNGLLADQNPQSIADTIQRMLEDKELMNRCVSYLSEHIVSNEKTVVEKLNRTIIS